MLSIRVTQHANVPFYGFFFFSVTLSSSASSTQTSLSHPSAVLPDFSASSLLFRSRYYICFCFCTQASLLCNHLSLVCSAANFFAIETAIIFRLNNIYFFVSYCFISVRMLLLSLIFELFFGFLVDCVLKKHKMLCRKAFFEHKLSKM